MRSIKHVLLVSTMVCVVWLFFAFPANGEEYVINCPLKEAKTEVTTPLPEGWWNTPQVGQLKGTDIQVIAGKRTLMCYYWAYNLPKGVSVMHLEPDGATCRASKTGFVCSGSKASEGTPAVSDKRRKKSEMQSQKQVAESSQQSPPAPPKIAKKTKTDSAGST